MADDRSNKAINVSSTATSAEAQVTTKSLVVADNTITKKSSMKTKIITSRLERDDEDPRMMRGKNTGTKDIGTFGRLLDSPGARYLVRGGLVEGADLSSVAAQLQEVSNASSFFALHPPSPDIIPPAALTALRRLADQQYDAEVAADLHPDTRQDLKVYLRDVQHLEELIGSRSCAELVRLFDGSGGDDGDERRHTIDKVVVRRCCSHGLFIGFHVDHSLKTLQLSLNDDSEYTGGRLVFVSHEGRLVVPQRDAGAVTVHSGPIVHAVTELESGVRYGLFLLSTGQSS